MNKKEAVHLVQQLLSYFSNFFANFFAFFLHFPQPLLTFVAFFTSLKEVAPSSTAWMMSPFVT